MADLIDILCNDFAGTLVRRPYLSSKKAKHIDDDCPDNGDYVFRSQQGLESTFWLFLASLV